MSIHVAGGPWQTDAAMRSFVLLIVVCAVAAGLAWISHTRPKWTRERWPVFSLAMSLLILVGIGALNALTGWS